MQILFFLNIMRICLVLLALVFSFSPVLASAQEILIGKVVSVERDTGSFVLDVQDCTGQDEFAGRQITIFEKDGHLSDGLVPGKLVRVWASHAGDDKDFFWAQKVSFSGRYGTGSDRTGVRYRLNRGSSMGGSGMKKGKGRHGR